MKCLWFFVSIVFFGIALGCSIGGIVLSSFSLIIAGAAVLCATALYLYIIVYRTVLQPTTLPPQRNRSVSLPMAIVTSNVAQTAAAAASGGGASSASSSASAASAAAAAASSSSLSSMKRNKSDTDLHLTGARQSSEEE